MGANHERAYLPDRINRCHYGHPVLFRPALKDHGHADSFSADGHVAIDILDTDYRGGVCRRSLELGPAFIRRRHWTLDRVIITDMARRVGRIGVAVGPLSHFASRAQLWSRRLYRGP